MCAGISSLFLCHIRHSFLTWSQSAEITFLSLFCVLTLCLVWEHFWLITFALPIFVLHRFLSFHPFLFLLLLLFVANFSFVFVGHSYELQLTIAISSTTRRNLDQLENKIFPKNHGPAFVESSYLTQRVVNSISG